VHYFLASFSKYVILPAVNNRKGGVSMATLEKLTRKPAISVEADATVEEVVEIMAMHGIGAVVVLEEDEILGIFSERDLINRVVAKGLPPKRTAISQVMTFPVKTATESTRTDEGLREMHVGDFRHLPITDEQGKLIGMVTIKDLLLNRVNELSIGNENLYFPEAFPSPSPLSTSSTH